MPVFDFPGEGTVGGGSLLSRSDPDFRLAPFLDGEIVREPRELPILFKTEMVQAILREKEPKTQTRRLMKPQPDGRLYEPIFDKKTGLFEFHADCDPEDISKGSWKAPYMPGDKLWVKETWQAFDGTKMKTSIGQMEVYSNKPKLGDRITYRADGGGCSYRSPLFMPRWASRILLEVLETRAEKVNFITEQDAKAEGVLYNHEHGGWRDYQGKAPHGLETAISSYKSLWDSLNAKGGNPFENEDWVWVYTFRRIKP